MYKHNLSQSQPSKYWSFGRSCMHTERHLWIHYTGVHCNPAGVKESSFVWALKGTKKMSLWTNLPLWNLCSFLSAKLFAMWLKINQLKYYHEGKCKVCFIYAASNTTDLVNKLNEKEKKTDQVSSIMHCSGWTLTQSKVQKICDKVWMLWLPLGSTGNAKALAIYFTLWQFLNKTWWYWPRK